MSRNIRGRLDRLEKATPAPGTSSIMTSGVFWAMLCGAPGEYTPAELAEWDAIWQQSEELLAAEAGIEQPLANAEVRLGDGSASS